MASNFQVRIKAQLKRKRSTLPVFVVVPAKEMQPLGISNTSVIEGSVNGKCFGRRTIKAWGKGRDDWFLEFTAPFCEKADLAVGDQIDLEFRLADTSTPDELEDILSKSKELAVSWEALTERGRREAGEHIRAAKSPATRERRANLVAEKLSTSYKK
ncbi:MAG: YdeI/OmpD-associated family protein [Gammaproteobacteria bacterium]|nr:YdeI/OmpD-associated family protein [Gammaproteobacteria bacterium]